MSWAPFPKKRNAEETALVKACIEVLKLRGALCWRQNTGKVKLEYKGKIRYVPFGVPGMADIGGILPGGRALQVECKVGSNKLTALQAAFLEQVRAQGAVGLVVYSVDELLKGLDHAT